VSRLPPDAVAETIGELACAIIPDPEGPGRRAALQRAVHEADARAGLGVAVGWPEAAVSLDRARAALALGGSQPGLVAARDRAGELLLRADLILAAELARDKLAPLQELSAGARARLTQTLTVWLAEQGRPGAVATRMGIHPQTARYRIARLRELFGSSLDDPDQRFWLAVALRVRHA
jgi:DNA-binding PucR family transcriptional regulator